MWISTYRMFPKADGASVTDEEAAGMMEPYRPYPRSASVFAERWLQPENIAEPCRIYSYVPHRFVYRYEDARVTWDGGCREGVAQGLGKVVITGSHVDKERIAVYEKGKIRDYCYTDNRDNKTLYAGECTDPSRGEYYGVLRYTGETGTETTRAGRYDILQQSGDYVEIYSTEERMYYRVYVGNEGEHYQEYVSEILENGKPVTVSGTMKNGVQDGLIRYEKKGTGALAFRYREGKPEERVELPAGYLARLAEIKPRSYRAMVRALEAEREALALKKEYERVMSDE